MTAVSAGLPEADRVLQVCLTLLGRFDPEDVTEALRTRPQQQWRQGEPLSRWPGLRRAPHHDGWALCGSLQHGGELEPAIAKTLAVLAPHAAFLRKYFAQKEITAWLDCFAGLAAVSDEASAPSSDAEVDACGAQTPPSFFLDQETIAQVAALGMGLSLTVAPLRMDAVAPGEPLCCAEGSFNLVGFFDPNEASQFLAAEPDVAWRVWEPHPVTGEPRKEDFWRRNVAHFDEVAVNAALQQTVDALLAAVSTHRESLAELRSVRSVTLELAAVLRLPPTPCAPVSLTLESGTLQGLAALEAGLAVDFLV